MTYLGIAASSHPVKSGSAPVKTKAFNLIREKSFSRGEFTLASGKKSNYYLDMKPSMLDPDGASILAKLVITALDGIDVDRIGGLELGAVPIIANVVLLSAATDHPLPGFVVRKAAKNHGTKKLIEGGGDFAGKRVVIVDDVTTGGCSAMEAVRAAQNAGAKVVLVLSIVDRQEGAEAFFRAQGVPFKHLFTARDFLEA